MREQIYEKVVADLIKFMNKLPHPAELTYKQADFTIDHLRLKVSNLIQDIDKVASLDARGWIK